MRHIQQFHTKKKKKADYPQIFQFARMWRGFPNVFKIVLKSQNCDGGEDVAAKLNCQAVALNPQVPFSIINLRRLKSQIAAA